MPLAITATDVAFVSVIVGGVTTIVGPFITWQIAKGGRKHERETDRSRRNYDARSKVYVELLTWARALESSVEEIRDEQEPTSAKEYQDTRALYARIGAFGSTEAVDLIAPFFDSFSRAWDEVTAAETEEARQAVDLEPMRESRRALEKLVREELAK